MAVGGRGVEKRDFLVRGVGRDSEGPPLEGGRAWTVVVCGLFWGAEADQGLFQQICSVPETCRKAAVKWPNRACFQMSYT